MSHSVMVDTTTFISAEEFLLAQNHEEWTRPRDPFAEQCYAELVQSLIYFDEVLVPHPSLLQPQPADYGAYPRILQHLFALHIARPMSIATRDEPSLAKVEAAAVETLKTNGVETLRRFVDKTRRADEEVQQYGGGQRMLTKIVEWTDYQTEHVNLPAHHAARIKGSDGVEDDLFGKWARASAFAMEGQFRNLVPDAEQQLWLIATLVRSLRYSARAKVRNVAYTPHPLRRDFSVMFDLFDDGASQATIENVISTVRGIPNEIYRVAEARGGQQLQLREQELPLLGGRLWAREERGQHDDQRWLELICGRIDEYRSRAADFRRVLSLCDTDEDVRRLEIDIIGVRNQLLRKLGLESVQLNETESALIETAASVASGTEFIQVPVTQLLQLAYGKLRRYRSTLDSPHQKFLYREFVQAAKP